MRKYIGRWSKIITHWAVILRRISYWLLHDCIRFLGLWDLVLILPVKINRSKWRIKFIKKRNCGRYHASSGQPNSARYLVITTYLLVLCVLVIHMVYGLILKFLFRGCKDNWSLTLFVCSHLVVVVIGLDELSCIQASNESRYSIKQKKLQNSLGFPISYPSWSSKPIEENSTKTVDCSSVVSSEAPLHVCLSLTLLFWNRIHLNVMSFALMEPSTKV